MRARPGAGLPVAAVLLAGFAGGLLASQPPLEGRAPTEAAPAIEISATGNFAPGGTVWLRITPRLSDVQVLLRLPEGLEVRGPLRRALGPPGETSFVETAVVGPVLPGTPVFVSAYRQGELVDSVRQPVYVGAHEGGTGEHGDYFLSWLSDGSGGPPWPLPRVAGGFPARLMRSLPREPEPRLRGLLQIGVILLQEGRPDPARRVLSRAWRIEEARLARRGYRAERLDHEVAVASAVALVRSGRPESATRVLGKVLEHAASDDPLRRYGLYVLGRLRLEAGERQAAARLLEEAVQLSPGFHAARRLLAP